MSDYMTIQQVANEIGYSTKTLRRWGEKGYLVPDQIQEGTSTRLYHRYKIGFWKRFFDLDRALENHIKKLDGIRKEVKKYMLEQDYVSGKRLKLIPPDQTQAWVKAHDEMDKWESDHKKMLHEWLSYPGVMKKASIDKEEISK